MNEDRDSSCSQCGKHPAVVGSWCWRCDGWPAFDWPDATESELEAEFIRCVKDLGGKARKVNPVRGGPGVFDVRLWLHGQSYHVELKKEDGTLRPAQFSEMERLRAARQNCCVLWGGQQMQEFLFALEEHHDTFMEEIHA